MLEWKRAARGDFHLNLNLNGKAETRLGSGLLSTWCEVRAGERCLGSAKPRALPLLIHVDLRPFVSRGGIEDAEERSGGVGGHHREACAILDGLISMVLERDNAQLFRALFIQSARTSHAFDAGRSWLRLRGRTTDSAALWNFPRASLTEKTEKVFRLHTEITSG